SLTAAVTSQTFDPDSTNNTRTATTSVSNPPPIITGADVDQPVLWPPNGDMIDVHVSYSASDTCGSVNCTLTVVSNEPQGKDGDYDVVSPTLVRLRAERLGNGNGRVYLITITCTDTAGNSTLKAVSVTVPHSQGKGQGNLP